MKKIKPVRNYAVFTTSLKAEKKTSAEARKEMIKIISRQLTEYT